MYEKMLQSNILFTFSVSPSSFFWSRSSHQMTAAPLIIPRTYKNTPQNNHKNIVHNYSMSIN